MTKQVLDVQQMQHLQELGLDTSNASMVWCKYDGEEEYSHLLPKDEDVFERCLAVKYIPAYTLQDVLELLPIEIKPCRRFWLRIDLSDDCIYYYYEDYNLVERRKKTISYNGMNGLIDAAYSMLCWAIENKFVETNKNE